MLSKTNMLESNAISTHLQSGLRLSRSGSDGLQNPFMYRFMGCALQYAANTCLKFPLLLTKFSIPWLVLWSLIGLLSSVLFATLKVLFSLGAAFIMPLFTSLFPSRPFVILVTGLQTQMTGTLPSWVASILLWSQPHLLVWSHKQFGVAWSSIEAEYCSLAQVTAHFLWVQTLLTELCATCLAPSVFRTNNLQYYWLKSYSPR